MAAICTHQTIVLDDVHQLLQHIGMDNAWLHSLHLRSLVRVCGATARQSSAFTTQQTRAVLTGHQLSSDVVGQGRDRLLDCGLVALGQLGQQALELGGRETQGRTYINSRVARELLQFFW